MEQKTLLSVLSPQLQSLVEASLGEKLQIRKAFARGDDNASPSPAKVSNASKKEELEDNLQTLTGTETAPRSVRLNPSELFVLAHPDSPGYVVKEGFLGRWDALRAHDALLKLAGTAEFHQAAVGHGDNKREEVAVRGDRIHWIQRPKDLEKSEDLDGSILHLMRKVEALVFGVKKGIPGLDLRNVTSTQLAVFPGDGARFVKHTDTYSTAHLKGRSDSSCTNTSLVRLVTCVYYLNPQWLPEHGGCLRVFTKGHSSKFWDISPTLDTLVVFRSTDVEHEVLPTYHERMAITIWYYGSQKNTLTPVEKVKSSKAPLPSPFTGLPTSNRSIFVAIPSYRDPECRHTVDDLLKQAHNPSRITIGICLQNDDEDDTQVYLESTYSPGQVRIRRLHYRDAAGPCVARAMVQELYDGEEFYLQIDSHMRFRRGWDNFMVHELGRCASEKPILTTYPLGYTLPDQLSEDERPALLCASHFDNHGVLRQSSKILAQKTALPTPSLFWAAGFAFSSGRVVTEVPYDASLRFLFFGEEASMSARLWTHGWDFYAPSEMPLYHLWTREYRPVFQELESDETVRERQHSIKTVLSHTQDGDSLGSVRSFSDYQRCIGVDFAARTIEWRAEWGNLDPIRFDLTVVK